MFLAPALVLPNPAVELSPLRPRLHVCSAGPRQATRSARSGSRKGATKDSRPATLAPSRALCRQALRMGLPAARGNGGVHISGVSEGSTLKCAFG